MGRKKKRGGGVLFAKTVNWGKCEILSGSLVKVKTMKASMNKTDQLIGACSSDDSR